MLAELCHEALAETHDLVVGLALRIEVGTALTAAHRKCCKAVLEYLLEAEELDNGSAYRGVESQTALVRTDSGVELYTVTSVYLYLAAVIYPSNSELDESLRLNHSLNDAVLFDGRISCNYGFQRCQNLAYCLEELGLVRIHSNYLVVNLLKILTFKLKLHCLKPPV